MDWNRQLTQKMGNQSRTSKYILTGVLLTGIIFLAFWIRIQGVSQLPVGRFTEHDAYLYHYQAGIIAEQGALPARDMHRWLPLGRDNTQLLSLYAYVIAFIHKVLPWLSLYNIQLYLPVVSFVIGLGVLFLFLTRVYGILFASIVSVLLATLPGSIERSAAGFGDRDAWSWMLGTLAVTSYLWQIQMDPGRRRYVVAAVSGITVFLGGLSWEGFGVFLLIVHVTELWKFCTADEEHRIKEYLLWMLMFVPWLLLVSPAFRSGYGFSQHVAALMLAPPLVIFTLYGIRYLLLHFFELLRPHADKLAWFLTLFAVVVGIGFFLFQSHTFETTAFAFRESTLMKSVSELVDPNFKYWIDRYGSIFIFSSFGIIATTLYLWKWKSLPLVSSLILFVVTTFFRDFINEWTSRQMCNTLFFISLGLTFISIGGLAYFQRETCKTEWVTLAMLAWFLLWVSFSRSGKRYDFFIGVPLAFFTAELIQFIVQTFGEGVKQSRQHLFRISISIIILGVLMFVPFLGAYTKSSIYASTKMRKVVPDDNLITALHWIKKELPRVSVVAAKWNYGMQLNVFGGVKTITDSDHYIPHWTDLYEQHVHRATSEREFLEFLKTHSATHIMLTHKEFVTNNLLRKQRSDVLVPVYPTKNFVLSRVKIWEIHYPSDIQPNSKYLSTIP